MGGSMSDKPGLNAAYGLNGPDDNRRLYADWAGTYDSDFAQGMDYRLPALVAEGFVRAGGSGPVLDIGAGTGLCGQALAALGVGPVDGTDLSPEMLARAAEKRVYQRLFEGNVLTRLDVPDGHYRGVVSSGTFTLGHLGPEALAEVVRVLGSDGVACLSINAAHYHAAGFKDAFANFGPQIAQLDLTEVPIYGAGAKGDHAADKGYLVTFRRA
jgi:predicted TPR repeat methyltransferase